MKTETKKKKAKKTKLTLQRVKALQPQAKRYTIWDTDVKGFGLRVNADGSKTYVLKYLFHGRQRWLSIGKHGSPYTVEKAREEALIRLGQAKGKSDPIDVKKKERSAGVTVAELCDTYLKAAEAGEVLTKFDVAKKMSTLVTDRGRIERHIKPLLGRKRVCDIKPADIETFLHGVASGKTKANVKTKKYGRAIVTGGRGTASRTVGLLGGIFTYAIKKHMRDDNPVRGVQRYKDKKNERFLSGAELKKLGSALTTAENAWKRHEKAHADWMESGRTGAPPRRLPEAENPIAIAAIRLLMLSGGRKSEILGLQWSWVDTENGYLRLPDSKTGAKAIPLGAPALEILSAVPRVKNNPYVFIGDKSGAHLVGLPKVWERVRDRAELSGVRLHDLRHSFASVGAAGGDSLLLIGALLGHRDAKTTQRYAHLSNDPVKAAANKISGTISAAMNGGDGAEIVPLPARKL